MGRRKLLPGLILLLAATSANAGDPLLGSSLYAKHCAGCHGANGKGVISGTPDFAGNMQLMVKPDFQLLGVVMQGKGIMPSFSGRLTETQVRDIIAHIRTFF